MSAPAVSLSARVDGEDRLVDADEGFAALNARAGGGPGALLATPQLAAVVRLARRLRIPVARAVTIADAASDLDCWVRAVADERGVTLGLAVLRERPGWREPVNAMPPPVAPAGAAWTWETDGALRLTRVMPEAGALAGFDVAMALGQPLSRVFALDPDAGGSVPILDAMAERTDFDAQPATVRESQRRVLLAGSVRVDVAGTFAGFVGGTFPAPAPAVPLAPAIDADERFNTRLDRALRGPLGRIVANADSINAGADGAVDPHYADYAADIASAGRHLLGLVDDLVDLDAIERDDFAVEHQTLDLADVARRAAGLLQVRAADAGVRIDKEDTDVALPAIGEFRRTLQIMVNLIGNALRYSPRGATVWLRLQRDGDRAVAIVADQGKGIAVADQARIFEKFERVDPSEPGGSGLGLYIARRLARAMGGDLTVDSAPGMGARFILSLPAA